MSHNETYPLWFEYLDRYLDDIRNVVWMYAESDLRIFERAYEAKDRAALERCMNQAWFSAPDNRAIYNLSGFIELCNLLDGTIEDWREQAA